MTKRTGSTAPRRMPGVRMLATAIVMAVALVGTGSAGDGIEREARFTAPMPAAIRSAPADGQVTAHDGRFWLGSEPILLHGINVPPTTPDASVDRIGSWGMNLIRSGVSWNYLEPTPPVRQLDGTWIHTYDTEYVDDIKAFVGRAQQNGLYVITYVGNCRFCNFHKFPDWLFDAGYNSKQLDYPDTEEAKLQAQTDFWTDDDRRHHYLAASAFLASALKDTPGVIGFQTMNEPRQGALESVHATTAMILEYQLSVAQAIRQADSNALVVFTTRSGYAPGVGTADFGGFEALGNVAFDVHDYFGGRWGDGRGGEEDPAVPSDGEVIGDLYAHVLSEDINGNSPGASYAYIGNTAAHYQFLDDVREALGRWGIPVLVGEFGCPHLDPGVESFFGSVTGAANQLGLSWSTSAYQGPNGLVNNDGTMRPWSGIVIEAARYEG